MRTLIIILAILTLISCTNQGDVHSNQSEAQTPETAIELDSITPKASDSTDSGYQSLMQYIGKYVKQTEFFDNPIVKAELERILKDDFESYLEFVSMSGSGKMNYKYGLMYGDVSQTSVGGYSSLIFVDIDDEKMFLFWLKERVGDKVYEIYGDRPMQANVLNLIEEEMNIGWGHVANFSIEGDSIKIESK